MQWNNKIQYCDYFEMSEYNGLVIIANTNNGMNFKMTKECFEILDKCIKSNIKLNEFLNSFEDEEDRKYFQRILETIMRYGIVVSGTIEKSYVPVLELTNRCNLRCNHCCIDAVSYNQNDDLSTNDWKKIIDKLVGMNLQFITITGGEPLVREDFFEIAEYAKLTLGVPMQLMSNATLISEDNANRLLSLFDDFSFSLDGSDEESCAAVRGKGVFHSALRGIEIMKKKGMESFSVSFTKVKQNEKNVDEFIKLVEKLGGKPMIRHYDVIGRAREHLELITEDIDEQFRPAIAEPSDADGHYYPEKMPMCVCCSAVDNKICITHTGDIYPCQILMYPEFLLCNANEIESIAEFWNNGEQYLTEGYKNFAEVHTAHSSYCKDCAVKLFCDSCVLYTYLMKHRDNFEELCNMKRKELMPVWN